MINDGILLACVLVGFGLLLLWIDDGDWPQ